jgi:hypothetical protein
MLKAADNPLPTNLHIQDYNHSIGHGFPCIFDVTNFVAQVCGMWVQVSGTARSFA